MTAVEMGSFDSSLARSDLADPLFRDRWSPRSFRRGTVPREDLEAILDAGRRSPSQRNTQPWRFFVATSGHGRGRINKAIKETNRIWCDAAPVLVTVVATHDGTSPDREIALFDTGSAWMAMALQAELLGYRAHAMGGIDRENILEELDLSQSTNFVVCVVAIGTQGEVDDLPDHLRARETRRPRYPLHEVTTWL